MATIRVTITIDEGVYEDAKETAAEHGMSVSSWISRCTQRETMRTALTRHHQWSQEAGLNDEEHWARQSQIIRDCHEELDRREQARNSDAA